MKKDNVALRRQGDVNKEEKKLRIQTLDAPVYEVKQDSEWYKAARKRQEDMDKFFDAFKERYGTSEGFGFYHPEYFGVHYGTEAYEIFKDEIVKNSDKNGMFSIKKRSKYFKEIRSMLAQIEQVSPFAAHDQFGLNNLSSSQWLGDRWFFEVKRPEEVKGDSVTPIDYKDYLKIVMERLDEEEA